MSGPFSSTQLILWTDCSQLAQLSDCLCTLLIDQIPHLEQISDCEGTVSLLPRWSFVLQKSRYYNIRFYPNGDNIQMAWFIEGGIWIGSVNIDIQTSMFVLEKKISQYCNFFLHFIQNRPLSDISTIWQITGFSASYCSNTEIKKLLITKKQSLCFINLKFFLFKEFRWDSRSHKACKTLLY